MRRGAGRNRRSADFQSAVSPTSSRQTVRKALGTGSGGTTGGLEIRDTAGWKPALRSLGSLVRLSGREISRLSSMPFGNSSGPSSRRDTTTIAQRFNAGTGVWTFLTPCLSANGAAHISLGQRPRSRPEPCQRAESPPHAHHQPSIPVHDESRLQRSEWSLTEKPRALPWAGMSDAVGVSNRPAVRPGGCLPGKLVACPEGGLI